MALVALDFGLPMTVITLAAEVAGNGNWRLCMFSQVFKFAEDKLAASLKAINEDHYLALEWINILPSYVTDETSSKTTEMICHSLPCF